MHTRNDNCKVIVLEINEISWELMRPWLDRGELVNFTRLRSRGVWGQTVTPEKPPLLEPWVTWVTFYTGVPQEEHGAEFLEQPPETIRVPRLWDVACQKGKKVGVYGSVGSWPPKTVDGFFVPGSFSPDSQTFPEELRPIQDVNLRYTRAHAPGTQQPGLKAMLASIWNLRKLGLNLGVCLRLVKTLAEIKLRPSRNWKKVSLQPVLNESFFCHLWKRFRPDLATFHTNHVAHYQHRFFRAWKPEEFPDPTEASEIERFGDAIHHGYLVSDWLLGRFMRLCDRNPEVVLCVASSMGQKPWVPARYGDVAPLTCRIRSIERLIDILGLRGKCEYFSSMAPQWNIRIQDAAMRKAMMDHMFAARYQPLAKSMYHCLEVGDSIVVTPISHHGIGPTSTCTFPTLEGQPSYPFSDLVMQEDDTRKSGCHDSIGLVGFYGQPIGTGRDLGQISTLDMAPTMLRLMGIDPPLHMKGQSHTTRILR